MKAERSLERLGATPLAGHTIVGVDAAGVTVRRPDGSSERVSARTVV